MPTNNATGKGGYVDEYSRELLNQLELAHSRLQALIDDNDQTISVTVTTAVPMDAGLRAKVMAKAQELYHAKIFLKERIDPSILGGIIFEATNRKRYDASVRAQLGAMKRSLAATYGGGDSI